MGRRIRRLVVPCLVTGAVMTEVSGLTIESKDLLSEVQARKQEILGRDSGLYQAPSEAQRDQFHLLASALWAGDVSGADTLADTLGYELVELTDTVTGRVYHELRDTAQPTRGWGTYLVELSGVPDVAEYLIQTPHPLFDTDTWDIGAKLFRESRARGFLLAGAHRHANGTNTADVADPIGSIFQQVHEVWNGPRGEYVPVQIHGFNAAKHNFGTETDAVLSNGDGQISPTIVEIDRLLEDTGFKSFAFASNDQIPANDPLNVLVNDGIAGETFSSLAARQNVQGIHSRGLGGEFIHIELERSVRIDFNGVTNENRDIVSRLIAKTLLQEPIEGDANRDRMVEAADLNILALHWQMKAAGGATDGDFTGDNFVDAADLNLLALNWQFGVQTVSEPSLVSFNDAFADALAAVNIPEPGTMMVFSVGGVLILRRRS